MVSDKSVKYTLDKCSCGAYRRATQLKRHLNHPPADGKQHQKVLTFRACLHHLVRMAEGETGFFDRHIECPMVKINSSKVAAWLKRIEVEAKVSNIDTWNTRIYMQSFFFTAARG